MNQESVWHLLAKDQLAMATIWNSAPKASTNNLAESTYLGNGTENKDKGCGVEEYIHESVIT